jgi:hypothetical protein
MARKIIPLADRFWAKVDKSAGPEACWLWTGAMYRDGYGSFGIQTSTRKSFPRRAHRVSWELTSGETIPDGIHVCHRCDNPACVNPAHLFLGTRSDNMKDCIKKGRDRARTHPETRPLGSKNHFATLTESDIPKIRAMLAGGTSRKEIAKRFGVQDAAISKIALGKTWRHVTIGSETIITMDEFVSSIIRSQA